MTQAIRTLPAVLAIALLSGMLASAETLNDYREFYRLLRINAAEQLVPCYPTGTPLDEPIAYGVQRDSLGRPTSVTRFTFGNPDTRGEWTTVRIAYTPVQGNNNTLQRRTFYGTSGVPLSITTGFAEEIIYRPGGQPVMRKYLGADGKPVNDPAGTSWTIYLPSGGTITQEWHYSNGKLHFGTGSDGPYRPFAPMPGEVYYRKLTVNRSGELEREEIRNFDKIPIPFPGGEFARAYELNACGQPTRVTFLTSDGTPMADSDGVATKTFEYDTNGRMTAWSAFDLHGDPKGRRRDGVAAVRNRYREFDGMLVEEQRFGAKGERLPAAGDGAPQ